MNLRINVLAASLALTLFTCVRGGVGDEVPWTPLFDGATLDGWIQRNGKAEYRVADEAIVGRTVLNTPNSFLCTEKDYGDFILELEFKVAPDMNSGVQIRSQSLAGFKNFRVHGYQVEIDPSDRAWTGGIYDEGRRGWLFDLKEKPMAQQAFRQGQWNHFRIEAIGPRLRTWVNGVPAADLTDDMTPRGFIALQVHSSRTAGQQIRWRNLRIKDLDGPAAPRLKALIIDGQNNHDWKACTPVLREILEDTGMFTVDVATSPAQGESMADFRPAFERYDVIVANYTGDNWSSATRESFERYMRDGGGLVVVHAADNAFPNWEAWNEMIGLGGWGGRNEKHGPYVYWRAGEVVRDPSPGGGGAHGQQVEFLVTVRDREHPITQGLPERWLHAKDELYSRLRGPARNLTLLATARQDAATGGTGRDEPALFVVAYGQGRVFHTVLGHAAEPMRCVGFQVTLQRGAEWAATGQVKQTAVPADFPTEDRVGLRLMEARFFEAIREYDFDRPRGPLAEFESALRQTAPAAWGSIELKLVDILQSSEPSFAAKQFVCRVLRLIGSERCVPALAGLLGDPELSSMSRYALQFLPAPEAGDALIAALGRTDGALRVGVVGSLGQRGDARAVKALAPFVASSDRALVRATILALGQIGGEEALRVLTTADVPAGLQNLRADARLRCADRLLSLGETDKAVAEYEY